MKRIFHGILIGGLLFGSVAFAAGSYLASDVTYTPDDSSWKVSNVNDALDSLHTKLNTKKTIYRNSFNLFS